MNTFLLLSLCMGPLSLDGVRPPGDQASRPSELAHPIRSTVVGGFVLPFPSDMSTDQATEISQFPASDPLHAGRLAAFADHSAAPLPPPIFSSRQPGPPPVDDPVSSEALQGNSGTDAPTAQGPIGLPARSVWHVTDFEELARRYNPTLAMAEARLQAARGLERQARALPNPSVGYLGDEIGDEGAAGLQGMTFGISVPNPWRRSALIDSARWQVRQELYLLELQRLRVLGEIRSRYAAAYIAEKRVAVHERIYAIISRIADIAQARFEKKEISLGEVLQTQSSRELARVTLEAEKLRAESAWKALVLATGAGELPRAPLAAPVDLEPAAPDWGEVERKVLSANPEYLAAKAQVETARAGLRAELRARVPQVDVETIFKHHNPNGFNSVSVGVSFPIPILDQNRGNILAAEAAVRESEANLRRLELQLRQRLTELRSQFESAALTAAAYRRSILPQREEAVLLFEEAFRKGEIHLVELLQAEAGLREAELEYWSVMETLLRVWAEIDVLLVGIEAGLTWDR